MTLADTLTSVFADEARRTRNVLEVVPKDRFGWRPHEKSFDLGGLAQHLAQIPHWGSAILDRDSYELIHAPAEHTPAHATCAEVLETFDRHVAEVRRGLLQRSDAELLAPWSLTRGGRVVMSMPKLSALRMIKSTVRNKEIDLKKTLEDADMIAVCSTIKKQWEETLAQAKAGGREDVVKSQEAELAVVQSFLPAALSDGELDTLVTQAIATVGAAGPKDMGKVMKALTDQTKGRADGKVVSERVKAKLEQLGK